MYVKIFKHKNTKRTLLFKLYLHVRLQIFYHFLGSKSDLQRPSTSESLPDLNENYEGRAVQAEALAIERDPKSKKGPSRVEKGISTTQSLSI